MGTPNLVSQYSRVLIAAANDRGFDLSDICRMASLSYDAVSPETPYITSDSFGRISRTVKQLLDDEACGFMPERCPPNTFSFVCESIIHEDTLGDALTRAFGFYRLISNDIRFSLEHDDELATLSVTLVQPARDRFNFLTEWWLMLWPHLSSWIIGEEITVTAVDFPHGPRAGSDAYTDIFWGPCRFYQEVGRIQFPASFLRRRVIRSRSDLKQHLNSRCVDLGSVPGVHRSWKSLIKTKMRDYLIKTEALLTIEELATEFNMSSQTLRRRLDEDGISFRSLKEEVRREVILKWLGEPNIPIGEVSLRAGFAERNGLVRAVRSWVGVSPREYRGLVTRHIGEVERRAI